MTPCTDVCGTSFLEGGCVTTPPTPRILAVDPSLTGTALYDGSESWLVSTKPTQPMVERMGLIADRIVQAVLTSNADLVVIESPISHGASTSLVQLGGLAWVIRYVLTDNSVTWVDIGNSQRSKWACGKGNAKKAEVLTNAVRLLGYDGHDDNVADVLWLHHMATAAYESEHQPGYRWEVLAAIDWPEIGGHKPVWEHPKKGKRDES